MAMNVTLISIGDELLTGRTVNTNAAWLGEQLASAGHPVGTVLTIGDDLRRIGESIDAACDESELVVLTGGLGPTDDDITREAICDLLGCDMTIDQGQLELIRRRFAEVGREINERSERQARIPSGCEVIPNHWGTAPALSFKRGKAVVYVLPGVPAEMRKLFSQILEERIPPADGFGEQVWLLYGVPESQLAHHLEPLGNLLDKSLSLAYLPAEGTIRLRLVRHDGQPATLERFEEGKAKIEEIARAWIVSDKNETLAHAVGRQLAERGLTLTTAESCTGGMIGAAITDISGSSLYYPGGVIVYSNEMKERLIGVSHELLVEHGAVSRPVARAMAAGARERLSTDFGVAVTGVAGPGGGTPEKPVGTVWIAVASAAGIADRLFQFKGERDVIRRLSVNAAFAMVLGEIRKREEGEGEGGTS